MNNRHYRSEETSKKVFQTFNQVYLTGEPAKAFGWELIRKDGQRRYVENSVSLIRLSHAEQPIGFRGIARDITELKALEKARVRVINHLSVIPGTNLRMGGYPNRPVRFYKGSLDEVGVFDRALGAAEIARIHNAGVAGICAIVDTTPDPFSFVDQTGVGPSTTVLSDPITVSGVASATTISITSCSGGSCAYSVDGGGWTAVPGVVTNGAAVRVRQEASALYGVTTDLILNIGGVEDTFSLTTTPDRIFANGFEG